MYVRHNILVLPNTRETLEELGLFNRIRIISSKGEMYNPFSAQKLGADLIKCPMTFTLSKWLRPHQILAKTLMMILFSLSQSTESIILTTVTWTYKVSM